MGIASNEGTVRKVRRMAAVGVEVQWNVISRRGAGLSSVAPMLALPDRRATQDSPSIVRSRSASPPSERGEFGGPLLAGVGRPPLRRAESGVPSGRSG